MIRRGLLWLVKIESPVKFWTLAIALLSSVVWIPALLALGAWTVAGPDAGLATGLVAAPLAVMTAVLIMPGPFLDPER